MWCARAVLRTNEALGDWDGHRVAGAAGACGQGHGSAVAAHARAYGRGSISDEIVAYVAAAFQPRPLARRRHRPGQSALGALPAAEQPRVREPTQAPPDTNGCASRGVPRPRSGRSARRHYARRRRQRRRVAIIGALVVVARGRRASADVAGRARPRRRQCLLRVAALVDHWRRLPALHARGRAARAERPLWR